VSQESICKEFFLLS